MKAIVIIDLPEDDNFDMLSPFNTKVTLDYGDKVFEVSGDVRKMPERKELTGDVSDALKASEEILRIGYNYCLDDISDYDDDLDY